MARIYSSKILLAESEDAANIEKPMSVFMVINIYHSKKNDNNKNKISSSLKNAKYRKKIKI